MEFKRAHAISLVYYLANTILITLHKISCPTGCLFSNLASVTWLLYSVTVEHMAILSSSSSVNWVLSGSVMSVHMSVNSVCIFACQVALPRGCHCSRPMHPTHFWCSLDPNIYARNIKFCAISWLRPSHGLQRFFNILIVDEYIWQRLHWC